MAAADLCSVEVVYALPQRQRVVTLELPRDGLTAAEAVERSGLRVEFPEIGAGELVLGVYGKPCGPAYRLQPGDRVEILRPLRIDPRQVRRERAATGGRRAPGRRGSGR